MTSVSQSKAEWFDIMYQPSYTIMNEPIVIVAALPKKMSIVVVD